jgi:WD40 repeat protein
MLTSPEPLQELAGHSHWVWKARFSPFHDQLLLSSSTDNSVVLWYLPVLAKVKEATNKPVPAVSGTRR